MVSLPMDNDIFAIRNVIRAQGIDVGSVCAIEGHTRKDI